MFGQNAVQLGDKADHVFGCAPVEVVLAMNIDFLAAVPFDAVGNAPGSLPGEKRRQLHAQPRVCLAAFCQTVVVVSLGEVDERTVFLGPLDCIGEIPLELSTVIGLEDFGIRPVEIGLGEKPVCHLKLAAKPLQQEDRVGIFLAHLGDDVFPGLRGNHISRITAESVNADAAPEEEDVRHVRPKLGIRIVQLDEIGPGDAPSSRRDELAVRLTMEPVGMMGLQRRRPACVIRGQVDKHQSLPRMHCAHQLPELVERRRVFVELGHRRVDGQKIGRSERTAVFTHHGIARRDRERRQRLDDPKPHRVHDERQAADDLAERTELPRKNAVDRIAAARLGAFDLDVRVASFGPLGHARAFGEETRLAGKNANLVQRDFGTVDPRPDFIKRDVRPSLRERCDPLFGLVDDFAAPNGRPSQVCAKRRTSLARLVKRQGHGQRVATPLKQEIFSCWNLCHTLRDVPKLANIFNAVLKHSLRHAGIRLEDNVPDALGKGFERGEVDVAPPRRKMVVVKRLNVVEVHADKV